MCLECQVTRQRLKGDWQTLANHIVNNGKHFHLFKAQLTCPTCKVNLKKVVKFSASWYKCPSCGKSSNYIGR